MNLDQYGGNLTGYSSEKILLTNGNLHNVTHEHNGAPFDIAHQYDDVKPYLNSTSL